MASWSEPPTADARSFVALALTAVALVVYAIVAVEAVKLLA